MVNREVPLAARLMLLVASRAAKAAHSIQEPPPEMPVFVWARSRLDMPGSRDEYRYHDFDDASLDSLGDVEDVDLDSGSVTIDIA